MPTFLLIAALTYLLGSVPFGYLLVRIFRGEDVRTSGSGNIGATNVARRSPALGVLTLLLDAAKGTTAVALSHVVAQRAGTGAVPWIPAWAALFAIVGHMFPVWLKFRGGKGVATALGAFAPIAPKAVVAAVLLFAILVLLFRYVSLGSIVTATLFPVLVWVLHQSDSPTAIALISAASLLIIVKHHQNLRRLLAGTENRLRAKPR